MAGEIGPAGDAEHDDSLALGGEELATELDRSPIHRAPAPFTRVGVMWEAPAASDLEIAVSADGELFSDWLPVTVRHAEVEEVAAFVGAVELDEEARFFRIRHAGGAMPTHALLELFDSTVPEPAEGGDPEDGISHTRRELTIGDAEVQPRSAWGADPANCVSYHSPDRATIHHTVTSNSDALSPEARLRQIQSYHRDVRGWCDIGYHFLVSADGRIWEGRPANHLGAHAGGANTDNAGVAFLGTHDSVPASDVQLDAVGDLLAGLAGEWGFSISSASVKGHRDHGPTSCPGDALYAQLGELRARAQGSGGGDADEDSEDPPPPPPAGEVTVKGVVYQGNDIDARIEGATVTLGDRSTTTSSSGYFEFENVPEGPYTLTGEAAGYGSRTISRTASGAVTWSSFGL